MSQLPKSQRTRHATRSTHRIWTTVWWDPRCLENIDSFELKEGAHPFHGWAFPIPKVHKETILKEIKRLIELGVLEWQPLSEWAAPSFIQPKKNKTVSFLTDFRELNKRLIRKPFPLPKISTVLQELEGFTFATTLDLNMGYYTIRLDPDTSRICTCWYAV